MTKDQKYRLESARRKIANQLIEAQDESTANAFLQALLAMNYRLQHDKVAAAKPAAKKPEAK